MRADSVQRERLMFFADENFAPRFDALREIGMQIHDDLAAHAMRTAQITDY